VPGKLSIMWEKMGKLSITFAHYTNNKITCDLSRNKPTFAQKIVSV
jgi:hypothetical protein